MRKLSIIGIIVSFAMTGTPLVIMSNHVNPFILGIPFFAFWNIFWPTMVFVFTVMHMKSLEKENL